MRKTLLLCLLAPITFFGCDNGETSNARLKISLTDAPADYEAVYIDVKDIEINRADGDNGFASVGGVTQATYNLLALTGGLDTVLSDIELPAGRLSQIRLILGTENTVVVDGVTHELSTPSAQQSGLKISINQDLVEGVEYSLLLDFDASRSVVMAGNSGKYNLKPVIRAVMEAESGSIGGKVSPAGTDALVQAYVGTDTVSSYVNDEGSFVLRGVTPKQYTVSVTPNANSGLSGKTVQNVTVTLGQMTDLGTITLE